MDEAEVASSPSRRRMFDNARVPFRHCTNCCLIYRGDEGIIGQNLKQSYGHLSGILKLRKKKSKPLAVCVKLMYLFGMHRRMQSPCQMQ